MSDTARLILVRHAESEGNRDRTFTQSPEVPLTDRGREQAQVAALQIAQRYRPSRVISSPYRRARETADIIAAAVALPIETEPAFREQSFGIFAGQRYEALLGDASYHEGSRWEWRPAGGESVADVRARAAPALDRIAGEAVGTEVIIVSHGGVMLAFCAHATGSWDGLTVAPNTGIIIMEWCAGRYRSVRAEVASPG